MLTLPLKKAESTPVVSVRPAKKSMNANMLMVIEDIDDDAAELSGRVKEVSVYASSFPTESPTPRGTGDAGDGTPVRSNLVRTMTELQCQGSSFNSGITDLADNPLIQTFEHKMDDYAEKSYI